jgi:replicative DNA helicase
MADGLFSFESEVALIGAAMYAPDKCDAALERLRPDHFGDPIHGLLWETIGKVVRSGGAPTPEIVRDRIGAHAGFIEWGGFDLIWTLWDRASTVGIADHTEAVADRAGRRAIKALFDELSPKVGDTSSGDYVELLGQLEAGAAEIARSATTADSWISAGDMVRAALTRARARSGTINYPFGVEEIDEFVGGLNAGEATWVAARTGMGKTVAGMTIARANATKGLGVCFFSLEMSAEALGLRLAADVAFDRDAAHYGPHSDQCNPTPDAAIKNGLSASQWARLNAAERVVDGWPLFTDDRAGLTISQMEAAARRQHRRWDKAGIKPGPVIIDHLGRVRPGTDRRGAKHAEVADISNAASEMAKRLGVPVVGLVQLNRGVENREDKRPQLSDLRQAGELEEDARQVVFIYRPEYYLRPPADGETFDQECERREKLKAVEKKMYWIVGKNSHGPLGEVLTYCDMASSAVRTWQP